MTAANKDTIYIDVDEEITGVIDKVRASPAKIVAIVLPKRASVLQSIVNMKLLKRSADDAKKHLVLITSEIGLLPLAGAVGLHVASSLQSKPAIPAAPEAFDDREETVEEETAELDGEATPDVTKPVGELAGLAVGAGAHDIDTIELDDEAPTVPLAVAATPLKAPKHKKDKSLLIPNFNRFRLLLLAGVIALILLIGGLIAAVKILPKAQVAIATNSSSVNVALPLSLSPTAQVVKIDGNVLPAKMVSQQKTASQQAPATGEKNNGQKANGSVTITNCSDGNQDIVIPAGTGVSTAGQTYITQKSIDLQFSGKRSSGKCDSRDGVTAATVNVISQAQGAKYNVSASSNPSFAVAGFSNTNVVLAEDIAGGTDDIIKVIAQSDIDAAKAKFTATEADVKQQLQSQLQQGGYRAITASYVAGPPAITTSANVGETADTVTVTQVVTYIMYGVKDSDLIQLINAAVKKQIDTAKQSILSQGLDTAKFTIPNGGDGSAVSLTTVATAGPDLNVDKIKQQIAGLKSGPVKSQLNATPGVTAVDIKLSPFWVSAIPKDLTKITVTIAKPVAAKVNGN
jgi:hypothetical protein